MKRGSLDHPKTHALAAALDIERWGAVGLLESLWHFTAQYALGGDIGRHSDDSIARAVCWRGASTALVSALVKTGWVDQCSCHRLRVHDWPDHADQTVQRVLKNRSQWFAVCYDDPSTKLVSSYPAVAVAVAVAKPLPIPIPIPRKRGVPEVGGETESTARLYLEAYNVASGRRIQKLTPLVLKGVDRRLREKAGFKAWQIIALPFLIAAQHPDRITNAPDVFLRDGSTTKSGYDWTSRAWDDAAGTRMGPELTAKLVAFSTHHELDLVAQLTEWQVTITKPEAPVAQPA